MITLYDVVAARREVEKFGFKDPGFMSSALYTLSEANEVLDLIHLWMRPDDMRARGVEDRDGIEKELAQTVFMALSCVAGSGSKAVTLEYDRQEPRHSTLTVALQMVDDALEMVRAANVGDAKKATMYASEVVAWAYLLADRYRVDVDKALWVWLASLKQKSEEKAL